MKLWLDGRIVEADAAALSPLDRGFLLGDGLFETILVKDGRGQRLDAHLARLERGAEVLGLPLPDHAFGAAISKTMDANRLSDGVARLTVSRGPGPRGVLPPEDPRPTALITASPLPGQRPPAHCIVARSTRRNEHSPLSRVKSLNYLDNILARQEAAARGADEAVLLNTVGRLAEATIANLFIAVDGRVCTPRLADGALPGVMRAELVALGAEERPLMPLDLARAEEAFLSSSIGLRAVASVDGLEIGDAERPVMRRMEAALLDGGAAIPVAETS